MGLEYDEIIETEEVKKHGLTLYSDCIYKRVFNVYYDIGCTK